MNDQSREQDPVLEVAKLEVKVCCPSKGLPPSADFVIAHRSILTFGVSSMQKKAFYQELMDKTGQGRLVSQEYSGSSRREQNRLSDQTLHPGKNSLAALGDRRHSYQPLPTPESERSPSRQSPTADQAAVTFPENNTSGGSTETPTTERRCHDESQAATSEEELVTLKDFIQGTERELVTVQDFFKNEYGKHK